MTTTKRPGAASNSARGGKRVLYETLPNTTANTALQRHRRNPPPRLLGWTVDSGLRVSPIWREARQ